MRYAVSTAAGFALLALSAPSTSGSSEGQQPSKSSLFDSDDFAQGFAEALDLPWDAKSFYTGYDSYEEYDSYYDDIATQVPYAEAYELSYDEPLDAVALEALYREWEYTEGIVDDQPSWTDAQWLEEENSEWSMLVDSYDEKDKWNDAELNVAFSSGPYDGAFDASAFDARGPSMRDSYDSVSLNNDLQALDLCDSAAAACSAECVAAGGGMISLQCMRDGNGVTAQCSCEAMQAVVVDAASLNEFVALVSLLDALMPPQTIMGRDQSIDTAFQPRPCGSHAPKNAVEDMLVSARLDALRQQRGFERPAAQVQPDLPPWQQRWPTATKYEEPPLTAEQEWGICAVRTALIVLLAIGVLTTFAMLACKTIERGDKRSAGVTVNPLCARLMDPESGRDSDAESSGDSPAFETPTEVVCLNPLFRTQVIEVESNRV